MENLERLTNLPSAWGCGSWSGSMPLWRWLMPARDLTHLHQDKQAELYAEPAI